MAILNELLEEAAARAFELAQQADEAADTLETLTGRAASLSEKLAAESEEAHRHFRAIASKVEEAAAELETTGQGTVGDLQGLSAWAGRVEARVAELLMTVKQKVTDLETEKARLSSRLEEQVESTGSDLEQVAKRIQTLEEATRENLQEAATAIGDFQEAVTAARQGFEEAKARFLEGLEQIEGAARTQTEACIAAIDAGLDATAELRVELANRMIAEHNDAVVTLRKRIAEEAAGSAAASVQPLKEAIDTLRQLCADHEEALLAKSGQVLSKVEEAVGLADRVCPSLDLAARL